MPSENICHFALILYGLQMSTTQENADYSKHPYPVGIMKTSKGEIVFEFYPDVAPKHVERMETYAKTGFYDGIYFHRFEPGFVIQGGDPISKKGVKAPGVGTGGSDMQDLPLEVSEKQKNTRGALAMARSSNPNSANSQFYIVLKDSPFLNMQYTVLGRVIGEGLKVVDQLRVGDQILSFTMIEK